MKHYITLICFVALLSACSAPSNSQPIPSSEIFSTSQLATEASTSTLTENSTRTPTITATEIVPTQTPAYSPTPDLPVGLQTPFPQPLQIIKPENAPQLERIARFGNGSVLSVEASNNGNLLAVVSTAGVEFYDGQNLKLLSNIDVFIANETRFFDYSLSSNGKYFAVVNGFDVQLWRTNDGILLHSFSLNDEANYPKLYFSPDNRALVLSSWGGLIIWQVETGNTLFFTPNGVLKIAFSPDGKILGNISGGVELVSLESGEILFSPQGPRFASNLAFSHDGDMLAIAYENTTWIWSVDEGTKLYEFYGRNGSRVESINFSDDGRYLVIESGYDPRSVRIWDVETNTQMINLPEQGLPVLSPDGTRLVTIESQNSQNNVQNHVAIIWDMEKKIPIAKQPFTYFPPRIYFSDRGDTVTIFVDAKAYQFNTQDGSLKSENTMTNWGNTLLIPETGILVSWGGNNILTIQDALDGSEIVSFSLPPTGWFSYQEAIHNGISEEWSTLEDFFFKLSFKTLPHYTPDRAMRYWRSGSEINFYGPNNDGIIAPDPTYLKQSITIDSSIDFNSITFTSDGQIMVAVHDWTKISFWQINSGEKIKTINVDNYVVDYKLSPDDKIIYLVDGSKRGSRKETLVVWDIATEKKIYSEQYDAIVNYSNGWAGCGPRPLAISPMNDLLVFSDENCTLKAVSTEDYSQPLFTIDPGLGSSGKMQFSPDGKLLATAFQGGEVKLWNTLDGSLVYTIADHNNPYISNPYISDEPRIEFSFSDDGKFIGTSYGRSGGTITLWGIWP